MKLSRILPRSFLISMYEFHYNRVRRNMEYHESIVAGSRDTLAEIEDKILQLRNNSGRWTK